MIDINQIEEHMEVVGSDGQHVGTVDNIGIKLTKNDPSAQGHHHYVKLKHVSSVDGGKLVLDAPAAEVLAEYKSVED